MSRWISHAVSSRVRSAFSHFLRLGRRTPSDLAVDVEVKYNPWHDSDDGRFTFKGQGRYFPAGSRFASNEGEG